MPAAPVPAVTQEPLVTVQDKIDTGLKLLSTQDAIWSFLLNNLVNQIQKAYEKMLAANPQMGSIEAVKEVVQKYLSISLTEKDCQTIQSVRGLFDAIQAHRLADIYKSFKDAYDNNTLGPAKLQELNLVARQDMVKAIVEEAFVRATRSESIAERQQALREFGIAEDKITHAQFSGSGDLILGDGTIFIPWYYVKIPSDVMTTPWTS